MYSNLCKQWIKQQITARIKANNFKLYVATTTHILTKTTLMELHNYT